MSLTIQNNKTNGIVVFNPLYGDNEIILDAAGADYPAGTVLGRITASGKLTKCDTAAVDGSQTPVAVLQDAQTFAAGVDTVAKPIISGQVRAAELVIYASGTPGAPTKAQLDQLRDFTIIGRATVDISQLDNQ